MYEPKFSYCDLDLEDRNPFFAYDALAYNDVSPYWVCFEHSNPTFSLDTSLLMMIYTQIEFGCKRLTGLELIKDIVETVIF